MRLLLWLKKVKVLFELGAHLSISDAWAKQGVRLVATSSCTTWKLVPHEQNSIKSFLHYSANSLVSELCIAYLYYQRKSGTVDFSQLTKVQYSLRIGRTLTKKTQLMLSGTTRMKDEFKLCIGCCSCIENVQIDTQLKTTEVNTKDRIFG